MTITKQQLDKIIEDKAAEYCNVKPYGFNTFGEMMYSSDSFLSLEQRPQKQSAFIEGANFLAPSLIKTLDALDKHSLCCCKWSYSTVTHLGREIVGRDELITLCDKCKTIAEIKEKLGVK